MFYRTFSLFFVVLISLSTATRMKMDMQSSFSTNNPAFIKFGRYEGEEELLLISTFSANPFVSGSVQIVENIRTHIANRTFS